MEKTLWQYAEEFYFENEIKWPIDKGHPLRRPGINLILNTCAYSIDELAEGPRPSDGIK
jgi:hypothetical protein